MSFCSFFNNLNFSFGMFSNTPILSCFSSFGGFGLNTGSIWNNVYNTPSTMNFNFNSTSIFGNSMNNSTNFGFDNFWNNVSMPSSGQNLFGNMNFDSFWSNTNTMPSVSSTKTPKNNESKLHFIGKDEDPASYDAQNLHNKWSKKKDCGHISQAFCNKVIKIAEKIKCNPNDLMAVMYSESRFSASIQNSIGATGLIQFLPKTAKQLGTSTSALKNMSAEQQLDYVEKFYIENKKMAGFKPDDTIDTGTLYALAFLPAYSKREVLCSVGSTYYSKNSGLDYDGDKKITKTDLAKHLKSFC